MSTIIDGSAGITTNAGGSVNPSTNIDGINYSCRAWVNFDGTKDTTGATSTSNTNRLIRGSGNVTSVLRNGTGDYTVTFTTAMTDANYSVALCTTGGSSGNVTRNILIAGANATGAIQKTASALRIQAGDTTASALYDMAEISVQIFR